MSKLTNLKDITKAELHNSPIHIRCIVSGKNTTPYSIPKKLKIKCTSQTCSKLCTYHNEKEVDLSPKDEKVLLFIDMSSTSLFAKVRHAFDIRCKSFSVKVLEHQNILRVFITQPTGGLQRTRWVGERVAYYTGHDLDTNCTYLLKGYQTVEPKTQMTTWVFSEAMKTKTDVENFELTDKIFKSLKDFQVKGLKDAAEVIVYLDRLYTTYARNVTKIYHRFDLHWAVDLVFHSALKFRLGKSGSVVPGWLDVMILGDTRCGKGHVAERLKEYYGVGEVVSGENCSYAGLIGGLKQIDKYWVISWGRIPVNDQGLVIIDEASNLDNADWTKLSRIRSEGIAEVTKIQTQSVNSRTRLLFLSNPPMKSIAAYSYGIEALSDLIKAPEDIARFDYAFIVSNRDVHLTDINREWDSTKFMYTKEQERQLIMWIWSRKPEQIYFTDKAVEQVYLLSNKFGRKYDITIPLIQGENVRYKLAKIAIAFAGRLFSCSADGQTLIVNDLHIECAGLFLWRIYKSMACGYDEYSSQRRSDNPDINDRDIAGFNAYLKAHSYGGSVEAAYNYFLNVNTLNTHEIRDFLGCPDAQASEMISRLISFRCIVRKGPNFYVKTPHFTEWLRNKVRKK